MNLTPNQAAAVEHRGSNLLVSASAGSGKTEVLARRCISLISDDGCDVDQLLVVTFTRAAAAELRVRIANKLHELVAAPDLPRPLRDHLRRQAVLVDSADICTLDSWCGRVVREHFGIAGVDPGFTTLDDEQARLLRHQVLDQLFESVYAGDCDCAATAADWLARNASTNDGFLREMVLGLDRALNQLVSPAAWFDAQLRDHERDQTALIADARRVLAAALADEIDQQRGGLAAALSSATEGPVTGRLQAYFDSLTAWHERLRDSDGGLISVLSEITDFKIRPGRGKARVQSTPLLVEIEKDWHDKRLKKRWIPEDIESIINAAPRTAELVHTLLRLTGDYRERLAAAKRERAAYEFADVERMALDLLGEVDESGSRQPTPVALQLRCRYAHILVDEYQDTSPVQTELLRLITRDDEQANRFMVGDVKQSIYGFRQAEPRLFTELLRGLDTGELLGRAIHLSDSFRSHERLLSGLNAIFGML
ncbi:MAG: UvrD-helicase domain-containing protein, partial [Planctomycetes bacterium]|nr:UvrD-helicase domain-containing protein [Planctomycetota bacterium]